MTIKYSIVIPTRNKSEYLPFAIRSILSSPRLDIELIVSNNFSTDVTSSILSNFADSRLKIVSPYESLPMAAHYEFALGHATGEWVTILGDDDAIMPFAFDSLDVLIDQYPSVNIISSKRAYYFWQGCEDLYGNKVVVYSASPKVQVRSTSADLYSALCGLRSCFDLPQLYTTCIVRRSLVDDIKQKSDGCFYHSIIPDMYSAVALSLSCDQYLLLHDPIFWVGTSSKSLGRSDRIYKDGKEYLSVSKNPSRSAPVSLSENVSYLLHLSAYGPMYIFECLLRCPLRSDKLDVDSIRLTVLAAVLFQSRFREKSQKQLAFSEILRECRSYKIRFYDLCLCFFGIAVKSIFSGIIRFPRRVLVKCTILFGLPSMVLHLHSTDRSRYADISSASLAVLRLRSGR